MDDDDHIQSIIERRMRNTGETQEVARKRVREAIQKMTGEAPIGWAAEWLASPREDIEMIAEWLRFRRLYIDLAIRFPPYCLVRAKPRVTFLVPPPGGVAIVVGYVRDELLVKAHPEATRPAFCNADDLELVGCAPGVSPEWVAEVLR